MNKELLKKHIQKYYQKIQKDPEKYRKELLERKERISYYQSWTKEKISKMNEDDLFEYISKLWSMLIWGNKRYVVDKIIQDKLDIISKLKESEIGDNEKLETIKKLLIENGSFTQEDTDYLEKKYAEYKINKDKT